MARTRALKSRMKAVANIRRITKTMQMIATSKFAKAQLRAVAAKPYTEGVFAMVRELAATAGDVDHPLISGPQTAKSADGARTPELWLIITSDRGLCGPYNGSVLRTAVGQLRAIPTPAQTEIVGKKGVAYLRYANIPVARHHTHFGDNPRREDIDHLAEQYMDRFIKGEVSAVKVAFTRFLSAGRQAPEVLQLLPLKPPAPKPDASKPAPAASADPAATAKKPGVVYEFSPPAPELLAELLPVTVKATLNQCFSDALVSEHIARMIAMKAATDNAGKMGKLLSRRYNRARQAQITTELTEIISGAQALE